MGLFREFFSGKLHVYYGIAIMLIVALWEVVHGDYLWLLVVVICSGIFADLWAHNYSHAPAPKRVK